MCLMMNKSQTIVVNKTTATYLLEAIDIYIKNYRANGVAEKCLNEFAAQLKNIK